MGLTGLKGASGSSAIPVIGDLGSPSFGRRGDVRASAFMSNQASQGWYVCYAETLEGSSNVDSNPLQRLGKKSQSEPTRCLFIFWNSWDFPASLMTPSGSDSLGWNGRPALGNRGLLGRGLRGRGCLGAAACPSRALVLLLHPSDGGCSLTQGSPRETAGCSWSTLGDLVHVEMVCVREEGR